MGITIPRPPPMGGEVNINHVFLKGSLILIIILLDLLVVYPGSYSSLNTFYRALKNEGSRGLTKARVLKFLRSQDAYSLHKPLNRKFKRHKFSVYDIDHVWVADLKDMMQISQR